MKRFLTCLTLSSLISCAAPAASVEAPLAPPVAPVAVVAEPLPLISTSTLAPVFAPWPIIAKTSGQIATMLDNGTQDDQVFNATEQRLGAVIRIAVLQALGYYFRSKLSPENQDLCDEVSNRIVQQLRHGERSGI